MRSKITSQLATLLQVLCEKGVQQVKNTDATYEDNKIFYKGPIPGITLRNIMFDDSVKEDIILSHYNGLTLIIERNDRGISKLV